MHEWGGNSVRGKGMRRKEFIRFREEAVGEKVEERVCKIKVRSGRLINKSKVRYTGVQIHCHRQVKDIVVRHRNNGMKYFIGHHLSLEIISFILPFV